ncbi:MAG TPA: twin-arginine translocation signal domain-containing protein [Xanthobacteraceae bacterium]|nr:twin-arginine translocation signal domain-containing protein [Xanthobacteraceae bacterium]
MKTDATKEKRSLRRRDVLRALGLGAGAAAAASAPLVEPAAAAGEPADEKRKARYQANSPDVQNYYRVNRYPK